MYEEGKLFVSVELRYNPEHIVIKDGVTFVDAHEDNALTGIAIVSDPACVSAVALDMVAERNADDSPEIITGGEEPTDRGETDLENKEEMQAEVIANQLATDEEVEKETAVAEAETTVAETDTKEDEPMDPEDPEDDKEEKEDAIAEVQEAEMNAEVLEHSVDTHESVENWGGEPVHVIEYHERVIETMEEAGTVIAELETQIAELNEIKEKYDAIMAERAAVELAEKQAKARAFAEKQGLDVTVAEVKAAIEALDYATIAEMTMAQVQEEEAEEPQKETGDSVISLASFAELDVGGNDMYGGLLNRRSK